MYFIGTVRFGGVLDKRKKYTQQKEVGRITVDM
jgi:hypothetical protein